MQPIEIPAGQIRADDVLCDINGTPFAVAATPIGDDEAGVWVSTYTLDRSAKWLDVEFLPGDTATVQRP